jgi:hypothetical protein
VADHDTELGPEAGGAPSIRSTSRGRWKPADQRRQAIETVTDSATAYVLLDVLPIETATVLLSRLGVYHGAPAFKELESE